MLCYLFVSQGLKQLHKDSADQIQAKLKVQFAAMMIIFSGMIVWEGFVVNREQTSTSGLCHTPSFLVTYGVNFISSIIFLIVAVKITKGVN
jgi:hypothetical protein